MTRVYRACSLQDTADTRDDVARDGWFTGSLTRKTASEKTNDENSERDCDGAAMELRYNADKGGGAPIHRAGMILLRVISHL